MKILSVLFLVSMAPSSRQLTCDNNLRRPGRIFVFVKYPLVVVLVATCPEERYDTPEHSRISK